MIQATTPSAMNGEELAVCYVNQPSAIARDRVINAYLPLVKHIIGRLNVPMDGLLQKEDLYHFGIIGLIDALDKFNPGTGASFKTFAYKRIYGEVLDNVRKVSALNRAQCRQVRLVEETTNDLRSRLNREPTVSEVCRAAQISDTEYYQTKQLNNLNFTLSLDDKLYIHDGSTVTLKDEIPDDDENDPGNILDQQSSKDELRHLIRNLPERERLILALYYYENLTLADIGQVLGVSESRVSQILNQTLSNFKRHLQL